MQAARAREFSMNEKVQDEGAAITFSRLNGMKMKSFLPLSNPNIYSSTISNTIYTCSKTIIIRYGHHQHLPEQSYPECWHLTCMLGYRGLIEAA